MSSMRDREEYLVGRKAEIEAELDLIRTAIHSSRREYVVGLPVVVTITDTAHNDTTEPFVEVQADLSELPHAINERGDSPYPDETIQSDRDALAIFVSQFEVKGEGHAAGEPATA